MLLELVSGIVSVSCLFLNFTVRADRMAFERSGTLCGPPRKRSVPVLDEGCAASVMITWSRESVVRCFCPEKTYAHVHCPCQKCQYSAVPPSVELKHWKNMQHLRKGHESDHEGYSSILLRA